jgi:hypothetical protein
MQYGVALNSSQAQVIAGQKVPADVVLSFCPATRQILENAGYKVMSAVEQYRGLSHAKAAVLIDRDLEQLRPQMQRFYNLSDGEAQNLSVYLYHFLSIAYYLYFSTRFMKKNGHGLFWVGADSSIKHGNYPQMYLELVDHAKSKITGYSNPNFSFAHYLLTEACNRILALILRLRGKKLIINFGDELPRKMINPILDSSGEYIVVASKKISKNMVQSLKFFIKGCTWALRASKKDKPVWVFRTNNPHKYKQQVAAPDIALAYAEVTQATRIAIKSYIPFLKTEYEIGQKLIDLFKPEIGISDFAKYPYVLAAQERMRAYGGTYVMMNHGTHTVQYDPISKIAAKMWAAQDRMITQFVTDHVPKSPLTEVLAKEIRPENQFRTHKLNVFQEIKKHPAPTDEFMLLHAGNFTDVYFHIPWCKETAEEYLLSMVELIEEMQHIDGVKLVIKLKPKKAPAHYKLVSECIDRLKLHDKVVVDTDSKFSDLLAKASMVICNLSGTVEEALINHIPVMIHTYHKGYFHIPAQVLNREGLNPAYLVRDRKSIKDIIDFTRNNREKLFDPELYGKVAWQQDEILKPDAFAHNILKVAA